MRAIDADALVQEFEGRCICNCDRCKYFTHAHCGLIDNAPTVEQPIDEWCTDCKEYDHEKNCCPRFNKVIRETLKDAQPTGEWLHRNDDQFDWLECSRCGWGSEGEVEFDHGTPFCPICGAKMKGGEE